MIFRRTRDPLKYDFRDRDCLAAKCWAPGEYQHRGATLAGSRNTGDFTACCMRRAYHGCPSTVERDLELAKQRKTEGWRRA